MTSIPQFVVPGQTVESVVLTSGGFQLVLSGGETIGTIINAGGIQLAGGTEDNTTIAGGGLQFVFSSSDFLVFSGLGSSLTSSEISSITANVASLGTLGFFISAFGGVSGLISAIESGFTLGFDGVARNTTVYSGGMQAVGDGAFATNTTVSSGGFQAVLGGVATSTSVGSGGFQIVGAGQDFLLFGSGSGNGEVDGSIVNGGVQWVRSGGIASGTVLAGPGGATTVTLFGSAFPFPAGAEFVFSGGTAEGTVVGSGSFQVARS
jgi:autotransporter passenger strand-loop-strand repeat protein